MFILNNYITMRSAKKTSNFSKVSCLVRTAGLSRYSLERGTGRHTCPHRFFYCSVFQNNTCRWANVVNPLNPELNPICYLLALLADYHFLHVSRIRVKLLTFRLLMSYIYGAPILDVSRSHTTTQHSR